MPAIKAIDQAESFARIKVVGVGGGGCNAINRMIEEGLQGVEFVAVNTDAQALLQSDASTRVRIGDTLGDVITRTLLVTKVRTVYNVEVTIPNSKVMSGDVLNYTTLARTQGVILQTTVTIGYDVPWRRVHELLVSAALTTEGIEKEPPPFVLPG